MTASHYAHPGPDDTRARVVELDAANPETVPELAAAYGITAERIAEGIAHGWPTYRYTGTRARLAAFLADQYDDGSGDDLAALLMPLPPPRWVLLAFVDYETVARINRPDWRAFLADADADPFGIACEVADLARERGTHGNDGPGGLDDIAAHVPTWLASVTP